MRGIALCAAGALLVVAITAQDLLPSPQTSLNLGFARQASFGDAIDLLEYRWPPLYPSLLWCGARLGLHAQTTNALLFLVTLGALVPAARLAAPAIHPGLPVTLYALCAFNYWNLQQVVSETLLVPLAIGVFLFSLRSRGADLSGASSYRRDLAALTALAAAACLSRYFAIFWLLPVAAWAAASPQKAHPLLRTGSVLAIAAAPVGVWIIQARVATGFLTGMDRFAPRKSHDHTTLPTNLEMTARTSLMDWFGTSGPASHAALRQVWEPSTLDIWLFSLGLAMMLACGVAAWHASRTGPRAEPGERAAGFLLSYFSFGYIGWVLVLWTARQQRPDQLTIPARVIRVPSTRWLPRLLPRQDARELVPGRAVAARSVLAAIRPRGRHPGAEHARGPRSSALRPRGRRVGT